MCGVALPALLLYMCSWRLVPCHWTGCPGTCRGGLVRVVRFEGCAF